ncbi:hypothetical protein NLJ89_g4974 [Agrocybe chaxingu]|uniref:Mitochondrial chaperone BCS1 n=1 Tax=Agrocybe chaxingu TaxID=84603 RepID=A0A9W8JZG7_9AGAR|nr:hypothetical protein NLJ89_g4974 [Agrocybe chaxingu]
MAPALNMLALLSAVREWLMLLVLVEVLNGLKTLTMFLYEIIYDFFFITAHFYPQDYMSYEMSRDVRVLAPMRASLRYITVPDEEAETNSAKVDDIMTSIRLEPSRSAPYSFWHKRRWMHVSRDDINARKSRKYGRKHESITLTILSWDRKALDRLLIQAKKAYTDIVRQLVYIYVSRPSRRARNWSWRFKALGRRRPLTSVILDDGVKESLISDVKEFLSSRQWYLNRGIPFRRGYLLYGPPGCGKTSFIYALSGELQLPIYILSLSSPKLDDEGLRHLLSSVPGRCLVLIQDIDVALSRTMNCNADTQDKLAEASPTQNVSISLNRVTLSGVLNALDGITSAEGRLLFATTNRYSALDPALCRPGRMDVHVEFRLASKSQAYEMFRLFFLSEQAPTSLKRNSAQSLISYKSSSYSESSLFSTGFARSISSDLDSLASQFTNSIPEQQFSPASLQLYLIRHKEQPYEAAANAPAWVKTAP